MWAVESVVLYVEEQIDPHLSDLLFRLRDRRVSEDPADFDSASQADGWIGEDRLTSHILHQNSNKNFLRVFFGMIATNLKRRYAPLRQGLVFVDGFIIIQLFYGTRKALQQHTARF